MSSTPESSFRTFVDFWKAAFTKLLSQSGAAKVTTPDVEPLKLAAPDDPAVLAVRFSGGGSLKGRLQWSVSKQVALQCAQLLMSEPLDPAVEFTAIHLDGFQEFIRQAAGETAVAWKQASGAPTELVHQTEVAGAFETQSSASFSLESDKTKGLMLRLDLDADMLASLHQEPAESPQPAAENTTALEVAADRNAPSNLDLILDVQLDATIRFGEREMLLQDVFGLMPGAVVELDHLVNEPAELLVAGRLVAKGEVVVVDGNFGLRVTEVLSRAQRAEALSWT
jgi:flagellar motor switch protein FliN/FliY